MGFDKSVGIGRSPFARDRNRSDDSDVGLSRRRKLHTGLDEAVRPPRLWAITQNTRQDTAGNVNRLNQRDPLTTVLPAGVGHGHHDANNALITFGDGPGADNGNG